MEVTAEILDYLHDARLLSVHVEFGSSGRDFEFTAIYHEDCGLAVVNGKTATFRAADVTILQSRLYGGVTGEESIDSCELSVSADTEGLIQDFRRMGGRQPRARLSVRTHSGSTWEVMCESLSLRIH